MCHQDSETCPLRFWKLRLNVTKGTVAFHAWCCANHSSMWSLWIAAAQCQCVYRVCLCDVPGAEPILGASSTVHHAAPSKSKISSSTHHHFIHRNFLLLLSFFCFTETFLSVVVTELKHFSVNKQTQYGRVVLTHKVTLILKDLLC